MEEFIKKLKHGDEKAFEMLVNNYQQKIYSLAFSSLGNKEDALDIVQEVFIKIYRGISMFNGDSALSTWIFRITKNTCYDFLRKKRKNIDEEIPDDLADDMPLPEDIAEQKFERETVKTCLDKLPPKYKMVLLLREYQDLSYSEIAKILDISEGTVKSRISRAREYLLNEIIKNGELF